MTKPNRALIVIDVQNDYDAGGALEIRHPPFSQTIVNVGRAMDAASAAGIPVIKIRMDLPATARAFAEGSHGHQFHPVVASRPHDALFPKTLPSAFTGTGLEEWLRTHGIDTVTVIGYMTHNCDLSTVIHALHMGFQVEILSDATGSLPYANAAGQASAEEIHRVILVVMQARFAAVTTTASWIDHVADGTRPAGDNVLDSYRRALMPVAAE
jgi:nicotinamidase-related amidase